MSVLPPPSPYTAAHPVIFKRLMRLQISHMDFEQALWELGTLLVLPRRLYRQVYFNKQTKNKWARDDPAVFILLSILLVSSSIAWSIIKQFTFSKAVLVCFTGVVRDFLLVGFLAATIFWLLANTLLTSRTGEDSKVEWAYAFDLHCNGFVAIYGWLYVLQLFLLPIVTGKNWISLLIGNTIYFIAIVQYLYIVYLGLSVLPFLRHVTLVLLPLIPLVVVYILSLTGYNIPRQALRIYFG